MKVKLSYQTTSKDVFCSDIYDLMQRKGFFAKLSYMKAIKSSFSARRNMCSDSYKLHTQVLVKNYTHLETTNT